MRNAGYELCLSSETFKQKDNKFLIHVHRELGVKEELGWGRV